MLCLRKMLIPLFPRPPLQPSRTVIPHGDYGVDLIAMGGGRAWGERHKWSVHVSLQKPCRVLCSGLFSGKNLSKFSKETRDPQPRSYGDRCDLVRGASRLVCGTRTEWTNASRTGHLTGGERSVCGGLGGGITSRRATPRPPGASHSRLPRC